MLKINKNTNNTIVLTLNEKKTLASPVFLFRFISDASNSEKAFIADDLSTEKQRFNEFLVTESASEILTSGTVELTPVGMWKYKVYEQTSTTNLDYLLATTLVEEGIAKIIGVPTVDKLYNEQDQNWTVYEA